MKINQNIFEHYPIEFKEVNPEDFPQFVVEDKIIIQPDNDGYINDEIQANINIEEKNTVVINAAVGQGKSYAILQTLKRYIDSNQKYLVLVASPFVSLVKQYFEDVIKLGFEEGKVFSYNTLGREFEPDYLSKPIQVLTVNCLLENPGEDAYKNSTVKRDYINNLIRKCKSEKIKVVFIYDEIHDSYYNFKQEYIFNLWKWKDVIHKNFIISATFNEASKVVIKYLAELTDRKIRILESKRQRFPEKQSKLYLHYSPSPTFTSATPEIKNIIEDLINRNRDIDILCFSKSLANDIYDKSGDLGKLIRTKYGDSVQNCTSKLVYNQRPTNDEPTNQYDENACNIGTNFKTGVNITKENHAFVIILPPSFSKNTFKNSSGIFSGGINSIIQALARQRKPGEIHIILPKPDEFAYSSLEHTEMTEKQKQYFISIYEQINKAKNNTSLSKKTAYISLSQQDKLIKNFFINDKYGYVKEEIEYINQFDRTGLPPIVYPDYETFKLERGEDYLADTFKIFGEDLSSFLTYSAITNQFINCRLEKINAKPYLFFNDTNIKEQYKNYFNLYFGIRPKHDVDSYFDLLVGTCNFKSFYQIVRNFFFYELDIYISRLKKKENPEAKDEYSHLRIKPLKANYRVFEIALLEVSAELYYGNRYEHQELKNSFEESYTRANYFLDNIKQYRSLNVELLSPEAQKRHRFFQFLDEFRFSLENEIKVYDGNADNFFKYLFKKPSKEFISSENQKKFREFKKLIDSDMLLKNHIFYFKRAFLGVKKSIDGLDTLYRLLLEDFFELEDKKVSVNGKRRVVNKINFIKPLPNSTNVVDTISQPDYREKYIQEEMEFTGLTREEIDVKNSEIIALIEGY